MGNSPYDANLIASKPTDRDQAKWLSDKTRLLIRYLKVIENKHIFKENIHPRLATHAQ